jgi:hypothetical protein
VILTVLFGAASGDVFDELPPCSNCGAIERFTVTDQVNVLSEGQPVDAQGHNPPYEPQGNRMRNKANANAFGDGKSHRCGIGYFEDNAKIASAEPSVLEGIVEGATRVAMSLSYAMLEHYRLVFEHSRLDGRHPRIVGRRLAVGVGGRA